MGHRAAQEGGPPTVREQEHRRPARREQGPERGARRVSATGQREQDGGGEGEEQGQSEGPGQGQGQDRCGAAPGGGAGGCGCGPGQKGRQPGGEEEGEDEGFRPGRGVRREMVEEHGQREPQGQSRDDAGARRVRPARTTDARGSRARPGTPPARTGREGGGDCAGRRPGSPAAHTGPEESEDRTGRQPNPPAAHTGPEESEDRTGQRPNPPTTRTGPEGGEDRTGRQPVRPRPAPLPGVRCPGGRAGRCGGVPVRTASRRCPERPPAGLDTVRPPRRARVSICMRAPGIARRPAAAQDLPEPAPLTMNVRRALRARRSSFGRFAAHRRLSAAQLTAALAAAHAGAELGGDSGAAGGGARLAMLYAFVNHVDGVEPGAYAYDPERRALRLVSAGAPGPFLQKNYFLSNYNLEQAGVVLVPTVRTRAVLEAVGDRGYRLVNATVGAIAQATYTAAAALGIGCGVALGFDNLSYREELDLEGTDEAPLLIMLLGHERPAPADFRYEIA
ncbi:nitroreductase family protein [Streptomyces harbinensis]|nr:nitroreductase family protein [Streptomyces harbinensis]